MSKRGPDRVKSTNNQSMRFPHIEFQELYETWDSVRGGKLLPHREDFRLTKLGDLAGIAYLLQLDLPDRIVMSFAGADLADRTGVDTTGLNILDYHPRAHRGQVVVCASLAAAWPNGVWHEYEFVADDGSDGRISIFVLPMSDPANDVRFALGTNVITLADTQPSDTLRHLSESSRIRTAMLDLGNGVPDNDFRHDWNTLIDDL